MGKATVAERPQQITRGRKEMKNENKNQNKTNQNRTEENQTRNEQKKNER